MKLTGKGEMIKKSDFFAGAGYKAAIVMTPNKAKLMIRNISPNLLFPS